MSRAAWLAMKPLSPFLSFDSLKSGSSQEKQSLRWLILAGQNGTRALIVSSVMSACSHCSDNGMKINYKRTYQPLVLMDKHYYVYVRSERRFNILRIVNVLVIGPLTI